MLAVADAFRLVMEHTRDLVKMEQALSLPEAIISSASIRADRCLPPFDRVTMDGIAVKSREVHLGRRSFRVEDSQRAGEEPKTLDKDSACIEVMTGACLPHNTDAVLPYEEIALSHGIYTLIDASKVVEPMQNVHPKGSDSKVDQVLVPAGSLLDPPNWGIAASVGVGAICTPRKPRIDVIATGDELVPVDSQPKSHQIRLSNPTAIKAALLQNGCFGCNVHHLADAREALFESLSELLAVSEFLIITGGVSAGNFDHIPTVLRELGVAQVFHKVRQRPGKPLWFGVAKQGAPVFGLPGNPVSCLVACYRYIIPALTQALGSIAGPRISYARLSQDIVFKKDLTLFAPVILSQSKDAISYATPVSNNGSGDFAALGRSDGFIELPAEDLVHRLGSSFPVYRWTA